MSTDEYSRFSLKKGERAVFDSVPESLGNYFVREILDENAQGWYRTSVSIDGSESAGEQEGVPISGEEGSYAVDSALRNASDESSALFSFSNRALNPGALSVTKKLVGISYTSTFRFNIELDGEKVPSGTAYTVTDADGASSGASVEEDGVIVLKDGQTATLDGILPGTAYSVTEIAGAEEFVTEYEGGEKLSDGSGVCGTITGGSTSAAADSITVINKSATSTAEMPSTGGPGAERLAAAGICMLLLWIATEPRRRQR